MHALIREALARAPAPRVALVRGLEACAAETSGVVFAIEEPELFLAPQAHRYLRRLIRRLAEAGNQVFFTTHAPGLLSVAALEEVNLVARDELGVTTVERLRAIDVDDAFRVMCEFDAERSELFFSRAAILVEGMTEKIALPVVFHALGHDADREQISIVECGGKANLPLFVEICRRARVPASSCTTATCARAASRCEADAEAERAHPPAGGRAAHDRPRSRLRRRRSGSAAGPASPNVHGAVWPTRARTNYRERSCAPSGSRSTRLTPADPRTADRRNRAHPTSTRAS